MMINTTFITEPTDRVQEIVADLDRLYLGRVALLLTPLCSPTRPHEHKQGVACKHPGKVPLETEWNAAAVERWRNGEGREAYLDTMARHLATGGNVGLAVPPGVLVLDADTPEAVRALEAVLDDAPRQDTANGAHFFVSVPKDAAIKSNVGVELAPGIKVDLRAAGSSQIAVEPSMHASGVGYSFIRELPENLTTLPELPAEWFAHLTEARASGTARTNGTKIHEGGRNDYLFRFGCGLRGRGRGEEEIREELHGENERHCEPPLTAGEVDVIADSILGRYRAGDREGEPPPPNDDDAPPVPGSRSSEHEQAACPDAAPLPSIRLTNRQLDIVIDDAVAALVAANDPPELFLRGGDVVSIRRDEDGHPIIAQVTETALAERLAPAARWFRGQGTKMREAGPTRELAAYALERFVRTASHLPPLRGVTESPLMRRNGSILDEPGYDAAMRLYYAPVRPLYLGAVPEAPSRDQVKAAIQMIDEILLDFPFCGDADYATALAALVTLLLRDMFAGCVPLFLLDAPAPGTGKGLVVDTLAMAATGTTAAKTAAPDGRDDEEWRKKLLASLLQGRALAVFDNIEKPLASASLAGVLTSATWTDRLLGFTKEITVPNRCTFMATGNNIKLRGDLPRRCVWARLDAKMARPWTRTSFRHPDLLAWVLEHRGEILNAVFTLARAWIAAARPGPSDDVPLLGSFENWRHMIGGILRVAGVPGFLANLPAFYDTADEDTPAWAAFLEAWRAAFGTDAVTVAELLKRVNDDRLAPLPQALPSEVAEALDKPAAAKRIGRALARKAETRFQLDDGTTARLVRRDDTHAKVATWRVEVG